MGKVLVSDPAQTKLRADFYANENLIIVAGTTCFPSVQPDSGDYFFVTLVRPATGCNGVYKEVLKVVNTNGDKWGVERTNDQCYRLQMDFRMGDLVYYEPATAQMLASAIKDGVKTREICAAGTDNPCENPWNVTGNVIQLTF